VAALIAAQRDQHQIPHTTACRALGVSRSWFYRHANGELPPREARRQALAAEVLRLFRTHRGTYGSPRITADLRDAGWKISENTVAEVMRELGLAARRKKKRRSTTRPGKGRWRAPDLVKRDFPAQKINAKWYGDGTEIKTSEGKLYLASVLDMASRRVLGFALGEHHDAQLAYSALVMAVTARGGQVPGVILHTDRGSEYTAGLVRQACERLVRAGQRSDRVLALHLRIRAALARALRDQGCGPSPGQRLDRGLQHPAAPFRAGHAVPGQL
jgi:transposase InsO family protein